MWQPIDTLPNGARALLWQRAKHVNGVKVRAEGMMVATIERETNPSGENWIWIYPELISGWEVECEMKEPSHWMPLPSLPE